MKNLGPVILCLPFGIALAVHGSTSLVRLEMGDICRVGGFVGGVTCVWTMWVSWLYSLTHSHVLLFGPLELLRAASIVAPEGVWTYHGWTPMGLQLWLLWGLEALIVVGGATAISPSNVRSVVCTRCGQTVHRDYVESIQDLLDVRRLRTALESNALAELGQWKAASPGANPTVRVAVCSCECGQFACMSVERVHRGRPGSELVIELLVDRLLVTDAELELLEKLSEETEPEEVASPEVAGHP